MFILRAKFSSLAVNSNVQIDRFDTVSSESSTMKAVNQHEDQSKMKRKGGRYILRYKPTETD